MKILNLYAGIGGNRKLWGDEHEITAVELDKEIAKVYADLYPNDTLIISDAHQYLLNHYREYDFIWSSVPCPKHSRARFWSSKGNPDKVKPVYPDMTLYEEIIFLHNYFDGKYNVENVIPYNEPLIPGKKLGRHMFWSNFAIGNIETNDADIKNGNIGEWQKLHGISLKGYSFSTRKDKILRNCVNPELGKYILDCAMNIIRKENVEQLDIFDQNN